MYAGLGATFLDQLAVQLGPAVESAAAVLARIQSAQRSGQSLSVSAAVAQAAAAGEIDPVTARLVSDAAGRVAAGASRVQSVAGSAGGVSQLGQWANALPAWAVPVGLVALVVLVARR